MQIDPLPAASFLVVRFKKSAQVQLGPRCSIIQKWNRAIVRTVDVPTGEQRAGLAALAFAAFLAAWPGHTLLSACAMSRDQLPTLARA